MIRPRNNRVEDRPYDKEVYKRRNIIERFFHRLKQFRRVATRYDKYADRYLGFVYFAALLITAKKCKHYLVLLVESIIHEEAKVSEISAEWVKPSRLNSWR